MGFFTSASKDEKKNRELLELLEKHPLVEQIVSENRAEILAKRTEAAEAIAKLELERDKSIPGLLQAKDAAEAEVNRLKAELAAAEGKYHAALRTLWSEKEYYTHRIRGHQEILLGCYDSRIDEAVEFFQAKLSWLRDGDRVSSRKLGIEKNLFTEEVHQHVESNYPSILSSLEYCLQAIGALEEMKLHPTFDQDYVEEMKAGVPPIDFSETVGTKPFPRIIADPRAALPSDSEMDWRKGKLEKKFEKWRKGGKGK